MKGALPMSPRIRFASWLVPLVLVSLCPFLLYGQNGGMQNDQSGMSQKNMGGSHPAMSVTGCLKQGGESGGDYLTSADGQGYGLSGKTDFSAHVKQTLNVPR